MSIKPRLSASVLAVLLFSAYAAAQEPPPPTGIEVPVFADPILGIDFSDHLREWDGFGVNYVETSQTRDYDVWPQEYGGFSILSEQDRSEILDLIFGPDGLRPAMTKLFLDVWHEPDAGRWKRWGIRVQPVYPQRLAHTHNV